MNSSSQKWWGFLLVVDSFFVVVFGGALAAKVYESWKIPETPLSIQSPRPLVQKRLERPASASPSAKNQPAKVQPPATPSKPPEPAAPKKTATPEHAAPEARSRPDFPKVFASRGAGRAVQVLFLYKNKRARRVVLAGAFILPKGQKGLKKSHGEWGLRLYLAPGTYRYTFLVNGKKILDPKNPRHDRHASVFTIPNQ